MTGNRVRGVFLMVVCLTLVVPHVAAVEGKRGPVAAQAPGEVTVHAAGRGNPWINLADGVALAATYEGAEDVAHAVAAAQAQPLSMAAGDFDEDGVPDLVVGYGEPAGLVIHRGNVDAIYPDAPQARERKAAGTFTDAPFLSPAHAFQLPAAPDFVGVGDFDNDGHRDVVVAARGGSSLTLLPGDGRGGFRPAEMVPLPGGVTALLAGDVYLPDGLADLAVGVTLAEGAHAVLVFTGPAGALRSDPMQVTAGAPVTGLALMNVDGAGPVELVAAAGQELMVVRGHDAVDHLPQPYAVVGLTVGNFIPEEDARSELAVLDGAGALHLLDGTGTEVTQYGVTVSATAGGAPLLVRARISTHPTDDLLLLDPVTSHIHILNTQYPISNTQYPTLDAASPLAGVLPMRLNPDALDDLVLLQAGAGAPIVAATAPVKTFVVDTKAHSLDANPGDGICSDGLGRCSLHAAISEANASAGADEVRFDLGPGDAVLAWDEGVSLPSINESVTIRGDSGGAPRVVLTGERLIVEESNVVIRGLTLPEGITMEHVANNVIEGCQLGTPSEDWHALAYITGGVGHQIGGTTEEARNVIQGDRKAWGMHIWGCGLESNPCRIQGNYVHGNGDYGIALWVRQGNDIVVGGTEADAGNVITTTVNHSGGGDGIGVQLSVDLVNGPVLIQGNRIGIDAEGGLGSGNERYGVLLRSDLMYTTIGGTAVGAGNVIAGNGEDGVCLDGEPRENPIRANAIYGNGGIGIDLDYDSDGPTPNDPEDQDWGANRLQNWPEISNVALDGGQVQVTFRVDSADWDGASQYPLQIDFYAGEHAGVGTEGKTYLGSVEYLASEARTWVTKSFAPRVAPPILGLIVATATDARGDTSEFSAHWGGHDIVVTTPGDEVDANPGDGVCAIAGGGCTLRAALQTANAGAGGDVIVFNVPGTGIPVVEVGSALPQSGQPVCIDGTTQPGAGQVEVKQVHYAGDGLTISAGDSTVRGLRIKEFSGHGIVLKTNGNNVVDANRIENMGDGVYITDGSAHNVIGGSGSSMANVIVGNMTGGIEIEGATSVDNQILGNYIGTDAAGSSGLGNWEHGVRIVSSSGNLVQDNLISGNGSTTTPEHNNHAVAIVGSTATNNVVRDNQIGTTAAGDACLRNHADGVNIKDASRNQVEGNVISCNAAAGVKIEGGDENTVTGNLIGTTAAGDSGLGNGAQGVIVVDGRNNTIGSESSPTPAGSGNLISGNGGSGVMISGRMAVGNRVFGNYIGTDITGQAALGNSLQGVQVGDATGNWIGSMGAQQAGNLISGNHGDGIEIAGKTATGNYVRDNIVGLNASAETRLPNAEHGIHVFEACSNFFEGNVVSGNGEDGFSFHLAHRNEVYRNDIGTNPASATGIGNDGKGIALEESYGNVIGESDGRGNVIGNNQVGIYTHMYAGGQNRILHNWIGVSPAGANIPNAGASIMSGFTSATICGNKIWYNGSYLLDHGGREDVLICANSIRHTQGSGIVSDSATIRANSIQQNNGDYGIQIVTPPARVLLNNIVDNAGIGLYTGDTTVVLAENNWWGAINGPGGEGPGSGDEVSANVDYDPWLLAPVGVVVVPDGDPVNSPIGSTSARAHTGSAATVTTTLFLQNWATTRDTLTMTVSDTEGWLLPPATFTVTVEDAIGNSVPLRLAVPASTAPGTTSEVTVHAASHIDPANTYTDAFDVIAAVTADLSVAVADPHLATTQPYRYAITVTNDGPDTATGVVLTDTLPVTATLVSAQTSQGTCAPGTAPGIVICQIGTLTGGAQVEIALTAVLTSAADAAVLNMVAVWGDQHDDDPVDNVDVAYTPVGHIVYLPLVGRRYVP